MKSKNKTGEKYTSQEIAESIVSPMSADANERKEMLSAFSEIRKRHKEQQSEERKLISYLLQLNFLIEDYLKAGSFQVVKSISI